MTNTAMNIHSAKLTFKSDSGVVIVQIRYSKKGKTRKERRLIPEGISPEELHWMKYEKEIISIYHRKIRDNNYEYRDSKHIIVPTSLSQRLEQLVSNVYYKFYSD